MQRAEELSAIYKKRLIAAMKAKGYTHHQLAREAGISPQAIYGYIEGIRLPRLDYIVAISKTLGVSIDWLAGRKNIKRGTWISAEDAIGEMFNCSSCGTTCRNYGLDAYCRECGAKMDGGGKRCLTGKT